MLACVYNSMKPLSKIRVTALSNTARRQDVLVQCLKIGINTTTMNLSQLRLSECEPPETMTMKDRRTLVLKSPHILKLEVWNYLELKN